MSLEVDAFALAAADGTNIYRIREGYGVKLSNIINGIPNYIAETPNRTLLYN